ncbi:disulfide bond formation protein DsbA, partial [Salmonella enterica subsp. enterica serovar Enteritidis]|nr:disulfide bond formation protein DsbA [Salmonella enterica subsp. enterica serovar Enteritidis]
MVQPIVIDVVSDVVCPWCFVGKKRLEEALAALPDLSAEVRWRPFQLDPTIPAQGLERQAYM